MTNKPTVRKITSFGGKKGSVPSKSTTIEPKSAAGCYIGDTFFGNGCEASIYCNGNQDVECTNFPSDVSSYEVYLLKVSDTSCTSRLRTDDVYLEYFDGVNWIQISTYRTTEEFYGWGVVGVTVSPNNWIGKLRLRWLTCNKEWQQGTGTPPQPCTPYWQCIQPPNGWEGDGCGNTRENPNCAAPYPATFIKVYDINTNQPLDGASWIIYDPSCPEPCIWYLASGTTDVNGTSSILLFFPSSYLLSVDKVGYIHVSNKPMNLISGEEVHMVYMYPEGSCIPDWQCETPLNGYEFDGCGNRRTNTICNPPTSCSTPSCNLQVT